MRPVYGDLFQLYSGQAQWQFQSAPITPAPSLGSTICDEIRARRARLSSAEGIDREAIRDNRTLLFSSQHYRSLLNGPTTTDPRNLYSSLGNLSLNPCSDFDLFGFSDHQRDMLSISSSSFRVCSLQTSECPGLDFRYDLAMKCHCVRDSTANPNVLSHRPFDNAEDLDRTLDFIIEEQSKRALARVLRDYEDTTAQALNLANNPDFQELRPAETERGLAESRMVNLCTANALHDIILETFQPESPGADPYCDQQSAQRILEAYVNNESCGDLESCADYQGIINDPRTAGMRPDELLGMFITNRFARSVNFQGILSSGVDTNDGIGVYLEYFNLARTAIDPDNLHSFNMTHVNRDPHSIHDGGRLDFLVNLINELQENPALDTEQIKEKYPDEFAQMHIYLRRNAAYNIYSRYPDGGHPDGHVLAYAKKLVEQYNSAGESGPVDRDRVLDLWTENALIISNNVGENCRDQMDNFRNMCRSLSGNGLGLFQHEEFAAISPELMSEESLERYSRMMNVDPLEARLRVEQGMCQSNFISLRQNCIRNQYEAGRIPFNDCQYDSSWLLAPGAGDASQYAGIDSPQVTGPSQNPPPGGRLSSVLRDSVDDVRRDNQQRSGQQIIDDIRSSVPHTSRFVQSSPQLRDRVAVLNSRGRSEHDQGSFTQAKLAPGSVGHSTGRASAESLQRELSQVSFDQRQISPEQHGGLAGASSLSSLDAQERQAELNRLRAELEEQERLTQRRLEQLMAEQDEEEASIEAQALDAELRRLQQLREEIAEMEDEIQNEERQRTARQEEADRSQNPVEGSGRRGQGNSRSLASVQSGLPAGGGAGLSGGAGGVQGVPGPAGPAAPALGPSGGASGGASAAQARPAVGLNDLLLLTEISLPPGAEALPVGTSNRELASSAGPDGIAFRELGNSGQIEQVQFLVENGEVVLDANNEPIILGVLTLSERNLASDRRGAQGQLDIFQEVTVTNERRIRRAMELRALLSEKVDM